jgi:hypothetical protein
MSLLLRTAVCTMAIMIIWLMAIANFVIESFFSGPVVQLTRIVNPEEILVEFPTAFRRSWKTDIIYPPATIDISGSRVFLKPGRYLVHYNGNYYWVSDDFVIVDYASIEEITGYPVIGGLNFILTEGIYRVAGKDIDEFTGAVEGILADRRLVGLVSYLDYRQNSMLLRRGIKVKVLDWGRLNANKDLLLQLENASDRSEYIFLSDGKLLRAR